MRFALGLAAAMALALGGGTAIAQAPVTPVRLSLGYDGRLIIKVLDIHFDEEASPDRFSASASLRSYGILALFSRFNVKASSHGRIDDGGPQPGAFVYDNQDGERDRKVQVAWRDGEVVSRSSPAFGNMGDPPASLAQKLASADPLTQLIRITLAPSPAQVCSGAPHFFDGKQLYALEFDHSQPIDLTQDQRALGLTSAVRCDVTYHEVAGFKTRHPKKRDAGLKSQINATFGQMGADGPWVVIKVGAETALGQATIELKSARISHDGRVEQE
jgi:hypothetical protein